MTKKYASHVLLQIHNKRMNIVNNKKLDDQNKNNKSII